MATWTPGKSCWPQSPRVTPSCTRVERHAPDRQGQEVVDASGTPLWHHDARSPEELKYRQAAKAQFEAQRQEVFANPQYVSHGNNFRFTCKACNKVFDSYYAEARHRDAKCSIPGK